MNTSYRALLCAVLILWSGTGHAAADPPASVLDLLEVTPSDDQVRWVYGAVGVGDRGVPVAGGADCDGDGSSDYAVAFIQANSRGRALAGEIDLVFGDGTFDGYIDTAFADPGVLRVVGAGAQEIAGAEIWIDDVTGDGLGDLLIGRQNFTPDPSRIGAGALTILPGGPALRAYAATLDDLDLADPPEGLSIFTLIGANPLDRLGIWVRTGDVTGDGVADLIVGADQEDLDGETNRGAAYLVRGGSHLSDGIADLSSLGTAEFTLSGHLARITPPSEATGYHFGATCQIADLDGNGRGEILAAAALYRGGAGLPAAGAEPGSAEDVGGSERGTVYIVWDDAIPTGAWPTEFTLDAASPSERRSVLHGASGNLHFGEELLGGRDYDHDGQADLFVGDLTGDGSTEGDQGLAGLGWVFWNAASLKGRIVDLTRPPDDLRFTAILGPQAGALSSDTAAHGDFDGDGVDDLVVASPHASPAGRESAGSAHVLFGRTGGWPEVIDTRPGHLPSTDTLRVTEIHGAAGTSGSDLGDTLGYSAAAADLDGDGRTDLLINEMVGNGLVPGTVDVGNLVLISGAALANGTTPPDDPAACRDSAEALCLGDQRFQAEVIWKDFESRTGNGKVAVKAADSGLFWFFSESNWELLVKVLDGCSLNDHFWVFSAAITNVEYTLKVTDTRTGAVRQYVNSLGVSAPAVTDTGAFATCSAPAPPFSLARTP